MPSKNGEMVDMIATSKPESPMYHSGKYHITTPSEVKMDQKLNCKACQHEFNIPVPAKTYTKIHVRNGIKHLGPLEASVEHLSDGFVFLFLENCVRDAIIISVIH